LIALEQEKPLRVREELAQVNAVVLEMLLDGSLDGARAVDRLERSGLPVRGGLSALVLRGGATDHLLAAVDDVLLPLGIPRVCLDRGTEVLVALPVSSDGLAADVVRAAATRIAPAAVRAGVATARASDLVGAVHRATTAADSATSRRQRLVDASSMAGSVLIADPATRVVLSRLADTLLGPLVEYDRRTGSAMLATLRTFLDHNGNIGTAASALGIHRHTLRARVERIREILDVELDSAHVRAELLLALSSRSD
jgi:purine catabolism regulator